MSKLSKALERLIDHLVGPLIMPDVPTGMPKCPNCNKSEWVGYISMSGSASFYRCHNCQSQFLQGVDPHG